MGGEVKKREVPDIEVSGVWRGVGIPEVTTTSLPAGTGTREVTGMRGAWTIRRVGRELSSNGTVVRRSSTRDEAGTDEEGASGESVTSTTGARGVAAEPSEPWLVGSHSGYVNGSFRALSQSPMVAWNCVEAEQVF